MKKAFLGSICLLLVVACVGCNTIKGVGEDISAIGGWMIKGSDNVKEGK